MGLNQAAPDFREAPVESAAKLRQRANGRFAIPMAVIWLMAKRSRA